MSGIKIKPSSDVIGAEILGVDLSIDLNGASLDAIQRAWQTYLVLIFRNQSLSKRELVRFSSRLGVLDLAPNDRFGQMLVDGYPELAIISNIEEDGRPIGGLGNAEAVWHTDMSYNEIPPKASALYSIEVPPTGGNTGFLNMYAAYNTLPVNLRAELAGRKLKHDSTHNSVYELRQGMEIPIDLTTSPGAVHPIVCTHPDSDKKALFLGRRKYSYVLGLSVQQSELLLDRVWTHCVNQRFYWHHQWRVGDLVLWDNRCVMHQREPFDSSYRRLMIRTQIQGNRPKQ